MSALAKDTYDGIIKKLGKRKKQPWQKWPDDRCSWIYGLGDPLWERVHPVMIKALDEMKDHGAKHPLAQLQEIAFAEALKPNAPPHVHTAALWLTDTRLRVEAFRKSPGDIYLLKKPLEERGIFGTKKD